MHRRAVRLGIVVLLLIGGGGAFVAAREIHRQMNALAETSRDVAVGLQAMTTTLADVGAAQSAYGAPGESVPAVAAQVASLAEQFDRETATLRPKLRSVDASSKLQALADDGAGFRSADQRLRQRLSEDPADPATGAFEDSRQVLATMRQTLGDLAAAEAAAVVVQRAALQRQLWTVLGPLSVAWVLGLLVLARVPKTESRRVHAEHAPMPQAGSATLAPAPAPEAQATRPIDLAATADLCTAIARMTSNAAVPDILARTASVLDASGIIVWMEAGDELFAAGSYGYDPKVIRRLGPIHRSADNATAAAWRTGEIRTVSSDMMANGAVVAPMFGPDGCIGVLAAEIRCAREHDPATLAVTSMIASQLAMVLSAWPGTRDPGLPRSSGLRESARANQATS